MRTCALNKCKCRTFQVEMFSKRRALPRTEGQVPRFIRRLVAWGAWSAKLSRKTVPFLD